MTGYYSAVGDDPSDFSAQFNGVALLGPLSDPNTGNVYTQFSFDVTATGSDTFLLAFRDDPAYIAIDNFVVTDISSVPEPPSLAVLALSVFGFGWLLRRSARSKVASPLS